MSITIKDVAKKTGLSLFTISKYLNGGRVKEKNRLSIEQAIEELGYIPNNAARGLRKKKTFTVGVIIPNLDDSYFNNFAGYLESFLRKNGYGVVFGCHMDSVAEVLKVINGMLDYGVDGIIFNFPIAKENVLEPFYERNIPVIVFDQILDPSKNDCILVDDISASYQAVKYLIDKGYKRIATIAGPKFQHTAQERLDGYLRVINDYGISADEELIYLGDFKVKSGSDAIKKFLADKEKPDAIFIANYYMCIGAVSAIQQSKSKIPEDFAIITFDDMEYCTIVSPTLSAIEQPLEALAVSCCKYLIKRMHGDYSDFPVRKRLPAKLHIRESC